MKKLTHVLIYLLFTVPLILINCESSTTSYSNSPLDTNKTQKVYIWAQHNQDSVEYTDIEGMVLASNMRSLEFKYIQLEDTKYLNYTHRGNYLSFSNFRIYSPPESINVKISTSVGDLSGEIGLPQNPEQISVQPADSIELTDSLQISWSDGKADAYNITGGYYYTIDIDTVGGLITKTSTLDTTVYSSSLTFSSNNFKNNGVIYDLNIAAVNVPGEENDPTPNMIGKGEGYLHYFADDKPIANNIIVGSGPAKEPPLQNSKTNEYNPTPYTIRERY